MFYFKIDSVNLEKEKIEQLCQISIDLPIVGRSYYYQSIEFAGWIIGKNQKITSIALFAEGDKIASFQVDQKRIDVVEAKKELNLSVNDNIGFIGNFFFEKRHIESILDIALEINGEYHFIGKIFGKTETIKIRSEKQIFPVMITAQGRSGTTILAKLLGTHPAIVCEQVYPYENDYAQNIIRSVREIINYSKVNHNYTSAEFLKEDIAPDVLASALDWIDRVYKNIELQQHKSGAKYFLEKYIFEDIQSWFRVLYSNRAKEIVLVRDFRDVFASIIAFGDRRDHGNFIGTLSENRTEAELEIVASTWQIPLQIMNYCKIHSDSLIIIRYEDLIYDPRETLTKIFQYLEISSDSKIIEQLIKSLYERDMDMTNHSTSISQFSSIGRWKNDISPNILNCLTKNIMPALQYFNYV